MRRETLLFLVQLTALALVAGCERDNSKSSDASSPSRSRADPAAWTDARKVAADPLAYLTWVDQQTVFAIATKRETLRALVQRGTELAEKRQAISVTSGDPGQIGQRDQGFDRTLRLMSIEAFLIKRSIGDLERRRGQMELDRERARHGAELADLCDSVAFAHRTLSLAKANALADEADPAEIANSQAEDFLAAARPAPAPSPPPTVPTVPFSYQYERSSVDDPPRPRDDPPGPEEPGPAPVPRRSQSEYYSKLAAKPLQNGFSDAIAGAENAILDKHFDEALDYCRQAARINPGSAETAKTLVRALDAIYSEADKLEHGYGMIANPRAAVALYRKAADSGHAKANFAMGSLCQQGQLGPQNVPQCILWYRRAAELGSAEAQNNLGAMLYHGRLVPQNKVEGLKWLRRAAQQDNASAQHNLRMLRQDW